MSKSGGRPADVAIDCAEPEAPTCFGSNFATPSSAEQQKLSDQSTNRCRGCPAPVLCLGSSVLLALALCAALVLSDSNLLYQSDSQTASVGWQGPQSSPDPPAMLGVQISTAIFGRYLCERHASLTTAWEALAGAAGAVDFGKFTQFTTDGLRKPLNATQAWWVFSELDENQDLILQKTEFFGTLDQVPF